LAKNLVAAGVFVIYLSTNQVFDGSKPFRLANDPLSPETEYGRQKAEAERRIGPYGNSIAIVRFTKVLEPKPPLFLSWIEAFRKGSEIHPFSDMVMAPVPLALAVDGLRRVAQARSPGVFQMSANKDITYEQAARNLARRLSVGQDLVQPIRTAASGPFPESLPLNTTLDASRLQTEFGMAPPDVWFAIESVLQP
jgi:dTDP-4-dehydrorhamnose reductase